MAIKFLNTVAVDTNVLYVDAINNRVGIGTNNPDAKLSVSDDGQAVFEITPFTNDYGTTLRSYDTVDETFNYLSYKASIHTFYIGDAAKVRINSSGDVGIGTTSPQALLHITGTVNTDDTKLYLTENNNLLGGFFKYNGDTNINSIGGLDTTERSVISYPRAGNTLSLLTNSTTALYIDSLRTIKFNEYSGTNKTGTPTYLLGTDASGNIVKTNTIPGSAAGPYLPLAGGTMTGVTQFNDHTQHGDQVSAKFGAGNDLQIYHDGSNSYIDNNTGNLTIDSGVHLLARTATGESLANFYANGANELFYDNSKKFETTSTGVTVTGEGIFTGNVGIGTTSPTGKLDVFRTSTNYAVNLSDTLSRSGLVVKSSGAFDSKITFSSGASSRQYIQALNNAATTGRDISINPYGGNVGIGTDAPTSGVGSTRILKVSSNGNSEVNVDHTDGGTSSDIGLFSFSRNGDHLAHMKATHDGATNSAFMSFHAQPAGGSFSNASSNERMRITSIGRVGIGTTSPNTKLDVISGTNGGIRISATDTTSNWRDIDIRSYVSQAQANALPDGSAIFTTNPSSQTETAFSKYGGTVIQGRDDGNSSFAIRLGNGGGYATRMFMGATGETTFSNTVQASGYKSSDGSAGITGTMTFVDHGSVTRTITYKNGLVVATS
jgi:hypothetical protein